MKRFSFGKRRRLVSNERFKAILAQDLRVSEGALTLFMAENDCGYPRLGVSVGRSCGNAVVRNRLKRVLREVFRQSQNQIPADFDYLLMVSPKWLRESGGPAGRVKASVRLPLEQAKACFLTLVDGGLKRAGAKQKDDNR